MEIVIAIAAKIVEYTVAPVGQWLCYSFHYNNNIGRLKNQVEKLGLARDGVQHSIDAAIRNGEKIEGDVDEWLKEVDEITVLARKVLEGEEEAKKKCSNGACLNLKLRHQLIQKVKKIEQDIGEVLENGRFDKVSYHPASQGIMTRSYMNYMDFESRMSTVKGLMEALGDANINVIGIWGMAGVGKTTLARIVARQAKEEKLFEEVAMADVTQTPDLRRIQGEIADMLDLKFDKETVSGRASRLQERLSQDRKILVILDDLWGKLELETIGIPSKGCKLVLISRNRDVLFCEMGTQKDFGLEVLPKEEAWNLFENMAGDCVKDPNLRCVATKVAEECAGLPIAIVTVSKALKNKNLHEWKDALQLLRRPAPEHLTRMQSTIYSSIELSYSHLESHEVQYLFLRCAEMGFSINYLDLLKYCYGLGTFHGINTLEEMRDRLYRLVRNLKDSCLLLDCPHDSEHYHMHDVVRNAATLIASKVHNMIIVRDDDGLKERLDGDVLKRCKEFSIRGRDFHELPNEMECPELRFLSVNGGDRSLHIPGNFFQGMERLEVLDFTQMQLSSLPSSVPLVKNLRTLCLDGCVLDDIAVIGELKNLVILSLLGSHISKLPREIGLLTHLRLLDLSYCSKLKVIPPNVLSGLMELEELYMGNSFVQWEAEGLNNERNNANLAELKHLCHLTTLEIHIRDASSLPKDLLFKKLERYAIFIGDVWDWSDKRRTSRTLKLKMNTSFHSGIGIKMLLKETENLYLDELNGVNSVLHELDVEGFQQLKHLQIQNNLDIKYIINSRMWVIAFPALETFHLKNMMGLEEIYHGQLPLTSFGNLRVVKVEHCDKLKFVFSSSIARGLSQIEELEIRECNIMGAIVVKEGEIEDTNLILFPKLRCLALQHLPKLISFLSTQKSFITDAGEIISEEKLDFYMPILHEQVVFPNLERLQLSSIHLEDGQQYQHRATSSSCRLENMQSTSRFQNLAHLEVQGSGNIKYLLSFSTARVMEQLKHLHILECKAMEEIIITEELGPVEERIPKVLFRRLECLVLNNLPMLKRFCIRSNIEFPSLKNLRIEHCPKLKTFIFKSVSSGSALQPLFNEEVAFPSLKKLVISHMDDLEIIWHNQFAVDSFCKLQTLKVEFCENLTNYIFQSNMLARFQSLVELIITDCGSLQEVFELQGPNVKETHAVTVIQLEKLYLARLPKLKHVWSKDPQGMFSFQNLKLIQAELCGSLKSFFPASIARSLMRLEMLHIAYCKVLEEIVAGEEGAEGAEAITTFVLPQVVHLHLKGLPRLKCFYPGRHASEWPMLKDLFLRCCHQVEIFPSKVLSDTVKESRSEICTKQPLFMVDEATIPNLTVLTLMHRDTIWGGQLLGECFCKLLTLGLVDDPNESVVSLYNFLKGLHNLRVLVVIRNCWEEVFPYEVVRGQENHVWILPKLRELFLTELPKLTHLWKEDTQPCQILRNLEKLMVEDCGKLRNLVPSSVSFQNLTELEILKCHGLINLVTSPTARSLVQLKKMSVSECESITKIVTREGGEANDDEVISFSNLSYLKLDCLPRLTNFCSGSYCLELPSLEEVIVRQCQEMKTFSDGDLRTPKLQRVEATTEDEWHWKDDDLNSTIHWPREAILLFKEEGFIIPEKTTIAQQYVQQLECSFSNSVSVDFSEGAPLPDIHEH
ncbi:hypothetical protein FH972_006504 [Carpinus fangiana]|uniref:Uncharacterized protein n=1 Tax=Carpinus fangiana TaxID=176857 RepID=A0A5N6QSI5_9ROSI|nr:hypothetical protein FH972_006504 [Carpinus fangiana]